MLVQEKIRMLRELNHWTQEDMAERMNLSQNGYAKIELGKSRLDLNKLQKIADIFQIDVTELINTEGGFSYQSHNYNSNSSNCCNNSNDIQEIEKLQLIISHQKELLNQKDNELSALKKLLAVYEKE
ncbi:MAG: helix-turn-helix transcriptional regulator [Moraxellaceae bacterium]|nr:helix-turn-helix transcriptional regulator [Moraxellaceae bacterium]